MYLCYVDESGTPQIPGNTSHFILAGLSIPIRYWRDCDREIATLKRNYQIESAELHVAWILRPYLEQTRISNFGALDYTRRRYETEKYRKAELLRLQRAKNPKLYKQTKKNYKETNAYIHLTYEERRTLIIDLASTISRWRFARLFAECIDKIFFDPARTARSIDEQAFEQVVSRFEQYLHIMAKGEIGKCHGLLIHDNNETVALKHTQLMKRFHEQGTFWTSLNHIIETPLFVNSQLTAMVQVADLCGYALRRYLENGETELFQLIFQRADRKEGIVVGIRHFTGPSCSCLICSGHRKVQP